MRVRAYRDADWSEWLRMSVALFPEYSADDLANGMKEFRAREDGEVFIAERSDGSAAGFVEVASRPYADGCDTSPVGYIEAWWVDPDARRAAGQSTQLVLPRSWKEAVSRRRLKPLRSAALTNWLSSTSEALARVMRRM